MKVKTLPAVERLHECFRYDPETGRLYWRVAKGNQVQAGAEAGWLLSFIRKSGTVRGPYRQVAVDGKKYLVHRIIYKMIHGDFDESLDIDHLDGDGLNNRPGNLRAVTRSVNQRNSRMPCNNTSGVTGVYWHKAMSKWRARVHWEVNGERYSKHLGYFQDKEVAAQVVQDYRKANGYTDRHGEK